MRGAGGRVAAHQIALAEIDSAGDGANQLMELVGRVEASEETSEERERQHLQRMEERERQHLQRIEEREQQREAEAEAHEERVRQAWAQYSPYGRQPPPQFRPPY